jgi:hypothetical protein
VRLALTLAVVLLAAPVPASSSPWHGGACAGVNFATLRDDNRDPGPKPRAGIIVGGTVERDLDSRWEFETGARYVLKGARFRDSSAGSNYSLRLEYLEVPMLVRCVLPARNSAAIFLVAGPSAALSLANTYESVPPEVRLPVMNDTKWVEAGFEVGAGVRIHSNDSSNRYQVCARFTTGLGNLYQPSGFIRPQPRSINQGLVVTLEMSR